MMREWVTFDVDKIGYSFIVFALAVLFIGYIIFVKYIEDICGD